MIRSFFELLSRADEADYYAFSDQDDYWMPDKMTSAIERLETMTKEKPALYCCRPKLVDQKLQPLTSEIELAADASGLLQCHDREYCDRLYGGI